MSLRLQLNQLGDVVFSMDGHKVDFSDKIMYKGTLFSGVPNLAVSFGYVNASWSDDDSVLKLCIAQFVYLMLCAGLYGQTLPANTFATF